jgi:hypothetical protein
MFRAKRIPGFIHFERLKHALDTRSQGGGHRLLLELRLHGQHTRLLTTRRPRFSEPQHYEHYAFSQHAAIAERSPQCPGVARGLASRCRRFTCQRSQRNQPRRGVA